MMKKIIIAVVILLLLGGGYYFYTKSKTSRPGVTTPTSTETKKPTSLKDLLTSGVAQSCTYSSEGNSGTVYVTGGKVRGDFETTVDSKVTKGHMIVDGNTSYIWMDGSTTGFKMSFDVNSIDTTQSSQSASQGLNAAADMNYKCSAWIVDNAMFTLPAGVIFKEFAFPSTGPASKSSESLAPDSKSQCSYCESLSGDSKTQCLTALKCN